MGHLRSGFVGAACVVSFLSCGAYEFTTSERSNDRVNPEAPLWLGRPSGAMDLVFRRDLTIPGRQSGEATEHGQAAIDPKTQRVFVGSSDHGLYALRATDGSTLWRFETLASVQSEPYYDQALDVVYFGTQEGALYALRAFDGTLVFRFDSGAEVARKPIVVGETLYFANAGDVLFAIDRRSGKKLWSAKRPSALGMEIAGYAGPTFSEGLIYMAYSDGHVTAYDAKDGAERWSPVDLNADVEIPTSSQDITKYLDADTTPIVDTTREGRALYVAGYGSGVFALDARTGARLWWNDRATGVTHLVLWREPAHQTSEGRIPERKLLVASSSSTGLWALDPSKGGREVWRVKVPEGGITSPVPCGGAIAVGTSKYGMFLLSPRNGKVIDGIHPGTGFLQTPATWGQNLYALSNAGTLYGFRVTLPQTNPSNAEESSRLGFLPAPPL